MTLDDAPDMLTVVEAAKLARVGRNQMYGLVNRGEIYGARCGRAIRLSKVGLARWMLGPDAEHSRTGANLKGQKGQMGQTVTSHSSSNGSTL